MPSHFSSREKSQVVELFFDGIRALGISPGAAKGDIKLSADGPVIGEIAARLSGGYMSGWTYPHSSGVRVTEAAMRVAVGLQPGNLEPRLQCTAAERAFISIPGTVRCIEGTESVRDEVSELFVRIESGSKVRFPLNNVQKCGSVICVDSIREAAVARAEGARRDITVRLEPFDPETRDFLFNRLDEFAPNAYDLTEAVNQEVVAEMPSFFGPTGTALRGIAALPLIDSETSVDWHGLPVAQAFSRVIESTGLAAIPSDSVPAEALLLGGLFWRAFLRGGVQGGLWVIDCIRSLDTAADPRWAEVLAWRG